MQWPKLLLICIAKLLHIYQFDEIDCKSYLLELFLKLKFLKCVLDHMSLFLLLAFFESHKRISSAWTSRMFALLY